MATRHYLCGGYRDGTDTHGSRAQGDTLTAYDFAMEEVTGAAARLANDLLAGAQKRADATTTEQQYSNARSVSERLIHLYPRVRRDAPRRTSLLKELALPRSRLERCKAYEGKSQPPRR